MKFDKVAIPYLGAAATLSVLIAIYLADNADKVERLEELVQLLLNFMRNEG